MESVEVVQSAYSLIGFEPLEAAHDQVSFGSPRYPDLVFFHHVKDGRLDPDIVMVDVISTVQIFPDSAENLEVPFALERALAEARELLGNEHHH